MFIHPIGKFLITKHKFIHRVARDSPIGKTIEKYQFMLLFRFFQRFLERINILHFYICLHGIPVHTLGETTQSKHTYKI